MNRYIEYGNWVGQDPKFYHMFATNLVRVHGDDALEIDVRFQATGLTLKGALVAQDDNNVLNYTVQLAPYVKVGSLITYIRSETAPFDVSDDMNRVCDSWQCLYRNDSTGTLFECVAWGLSRVEETEFSNPLAPFLTSGIEVNVYEQFKIIE